MKGKRILIITSLIIIFVLTCMIVPVIVSALWKSPIYVGIVPIRTNDTPNMGYSILNPQASGAGQVLWNFVEYDGNGSGASIKSNGNKNIYCLKANVGFTSTDEIVKYNSFYDLSIEEEKIQALNDTVLNSLLESTIPVNGGGKISAFDAVLALSDIFYVIDENETSAQITKSKNEYLEKAGIDTTGNQWSALLTRDEIMAIQQAVVWYFTNYSESGKFNQLNSSSWLFYTEGNNTYNALTNYDRRNGTGVQRNEQAKILYRYLIDQVKENTKKVSNPTTSKEHFSIDVSNSYEEVGSNFIIGPMKITKDSGVTTLDSIAFTVKNAGAQTTNYKLLNKNKAEVTSGTTVNDLIGENFYISVPVNSVKGNISADIELNYNNYTINLGTSTESDSEQPIMIVDKDATKKTVKNHLEVTPIKKEFDLALRKYITNVGGTEITTRIPTVDESTLTGETTATYKHRKDPIEVTTGTKVIYTLAVYNEGEKEGRATKLVDQLPTGLKYVRVVSGNFEEEAYNETDNTLKLKRKEENTTNLPAYTSGKLATDCRELIQIECEVIATAGATDKVLTNVAWIAEEVDGVTGEKITDQKGKDRDSEPLTKPLVNKDNMENYTGNDNKEDLTDSNNYYKGQQDDDDFEKLILKKAEGSYNLKLIKVDSAEATKKLSGAEFEIKINGGEAQTKTTDTNGELTIEGIDIIEEGTDTIEIRETKAPAGYNKIIDTVELTVTKAIQNGSYVVTNVTNIETNGVNAIVNDGTVEATVQNSKIEGSYNLKLIKVDSADVTKKLSGAEFEIKINGGETQTKTTDTNGELTIEGIDITEEGTDTIEITEKTAPTGYNKIIDAVTLNVTKAIQNGSYVVTNVTNSETNGVNAIVNDGTVEATVQNSKIEGSYNLKLIKVDSADATKKLSGAEFEIKVNGGETQTKTTDDNGSISINGIGITEEGTDTLEIKETKAPTGYNKTIDAVTLTVTKEIKNGSYVVTNVTSSETNGVNAIVNDGTVEATVQNSKIEGSYNLKLIKVDSAEATKKLSGAEFEIKVNGGETQAKTTDENGSISINGINITEEGTDTIEIKETKAPTGYNKIIDAVTLTVTKAIQNGNYVVTNVTNSETNGVSATVKDGTVEATVQNSKIEGSYNLKLIKVDSAEVTKKLSGAEFEMKVNGGKTQTKTTDTNGELAIEGIGITEVGTDTIELTEKKAPTGYNKIIDTVELTVTKEIKNGNYVVTNVTNSETNGVNAIVNDGTVEATVQNSKIEGSYNLKLIKVDSADATKKLSGAEFEIKVNGGETQTKTTDDNGSISINGIGITEEGTDTLEIKETKAPTGYNKTIDAVTLTVTKEIQNGNYVVTNVTSSETNGVNATVNEETVEVTVPNERKVADFKLIKRIVEVNNEEVAERIEKVDVSKLNTLDENGKMITTGEYTLNKEPVAVRKGNIVTYKIRVYNEGFQDGYVQEITEKVPEGLEVLWSEDGENKDEKNNTELSKEEKEAIEFNKKYGWKNPKYDENNKIAEISSDHLSKEKENPEGANLIKAFGENDGTKTEKDIDFREIPIKMRVTSNALTQTVITNEAAITDDADDEGKDVDDRDSTPEDWKEHPDHEDDEDHDSVILQNFDLALRKFIIAISKDETVKDSEYLKNSDGTYKREPQVDTSKLNQLDEEGNLITTAIYNHTKEPILLQKSDIVVYMLRVYNEGEIDGYAAEIKDNLPEGLEFVDGEFNKQYGWEVSKDGRIVKTTYLADSKIGKTEKDENGEYVLKYREVPIMCKVKDSVPTSTNITNIADITKYQDDKKEPITDRDSKEDNLDVPEDKDLPNYNDDKKDDYIPGQEDDDDFEKIIVKEFDLALRKWVTQAIVTDSKGTTVTNTGHKPYDDPEQIVKVELHRKKINEVTVKFRYSIRVINEGEIAGYAKEITDYVPQGLKFVAEDNKGWTDEGNNVISTKLLENKLLQPGEYADVEVILTWINNKENMGVKTNIAEISEDYNEYNVPDKDSTPDNQKPGEDDIDDAPVMLSVATGRAKTYFTLGCTILVILAGGLVGIKKYVL